jgi:hypothetical protein
MIFATVNITEAQNETDTANITMKEHRHEVSVYGAGGMSNLTYSLDKNGSKTDEFGGIFGIGYTWNINESFAIVTGVEMTNYNAKTTYDAISIPKIYGTGLDRFEYTYSMNKYIEEQDAVLLSAPVMLQYSIPLSASVKYYISGGVKVGLPVRTNAAIFPGTVNTSGYFYFENQIYTDLPHHGFVSGIHPNSTNSDIDLMVSLAASLESGVRFSLTKNILLYTGAYLDYGMNNIQSKRNKHLINYQEFNPSVLEYSSVLNTSLANKVKIFGAGLKLKISFGWL